MKLTFADGEKIGVFEDGKKTVYESAYIRKYKENTLQSVKNREWKSRTDAMLAEDYYFNMPDETEVRAAVTAVTPTVEDNKLIYAFVLNGTSGIYYKYTDDKEKTEAHVLSSNELEFRSLSVFQTGETLGTVQTDSVSSRIAIFGKNGDFKYLTDGDSLDENPTFDKDGNILFNSYAVGRDSGNNFVAYMPSEIYSLNPATMEMRELVTDEKYSYIKPFADGKGNVYCIRKTDAEQKENVFLQILLIPVRIVQALVGFISAFVACFAKKPLIGGQSARSLGNGEMARNGADGKKAWINNTLVNIDKEWKRNKKSDEYGLIPRSWKLVKLVPDEQGNFERFQEYELASGVADFVYAEENGETVLFYTNGKHVFKVWDYGAGGKKEKLFDTDFCVRLGILQKRNTLSDDGLFDSL